MSGGFDPAMEARLRALGADLGAILDLGERQRELLAEGRRLGQLVNQQRAQANREAWRAKAKHLREERPYLLTEQVAVEVWEWCRTNGVKLRNDKTYSLRTILDDLKRHPSLL